MIPGLDNYLNGNSRFYRPTRVYECSECQAEWPAPFETHPCPACGGERCEACPTRCCDACGKHACTDTCIVCIDDEQLCRACAEEHEKALCQCVTCYCGGDHCRCGQEYQCERCRPDLQHNAPAAEAEEVPFWGGEPPF